MPLQRGEGARLRSRTGPATSSDVVRADHDHGPEAPELAPGLAADALMVVLAGLDDQKAEDVVSIDITGKTPLADHMVVASGRSHRHVGAIADRILRDLKDAGLGSAKVEGLPHCDWVLIDAGDVIVHVFRPEVRAFYNLEKMWSAETPEAARVHVVG